MSGQTHSDARSAFIAVKPAVLAADAVGDWAEVLTLLAPVATDAAGLWPLEAHLRLGRALEQLRQPDQARLVYATVRRHWPDTAAGWRGGAQAAHDCADWAEAAALWEACIQRFTQDQPLFWWMGLATALRQLDRKAEAMAAFDTLCARWPDNREAGAARAWLANAMGSWPRAARIWNDFSDRFGDRFTTDLARGHIVALIFAGRHQRAAQEIDRLHQRDPDSGHWMKLRIDLLMALGDARAAAETVAGFTGHALFATFFPPQALAQIGFEAGYTVAETTVWLRGMVGEEVARAEAQTRFHPDNRLADRDLQSVIDTYQGLLRQNWEANYRAAMTKFLAQHHCDDFARAVTLAVNYQSRARLKRLLALALARYPHARITCQLDAFLRGQTVPAADPEESFASRWRNVLPSAENSVRDQIAGRPWRRLVCAVAVCDEAEMLPVFVAHYRSLGVESFIIIDNASKTPAAEVLGPLPGLEMTYVDAPFNYVEAFSGMGWINEVLEAGICDWLLAPDCDELLTYPGAAERPISDLLDHLDARGETALVAQMIDVYDRAFLEGKIPSGDIAEHRLFCASHEIENGLLPPWRGLVNRNRPGGIVSLEPIKATLVKGSAGLRYARSHNVTSCRVAQTTGVVRHYKIFRDRDMIARPSDEVLAHSRVRNRQKFTIARHLADSKRVVDASYDHPFHLEFTEERLMRLGYMVADAGWRARLGRRLPADTKAPAMKVRESLGRRHLVGAYNFPATDAHLTEVLTRLRALAGSGLRQEMRLFLNAQIARIGRREVALGLLLYAADQLGRREAVARLHRSALNTIRGAGQEASIAGICSIADALGDRERLAIPLLETLEAVRGEDDRISIRKGVMLSNAGRHREAVAALAVAGPKFGDRGLVRLFLSNARLGDWEFHRRKLDACMADKAFEPSPGLLDCISMLPVPGWRRAALERLADRILPEAERYQGTAMSSCLAVLHLLGRDAELREAAAAFGDRLPADAKLFFTRLLAAKAGARPVNRIWGLGLSRTGTSSLHVYCQSLGLLSAHWQNPFLGTLVDRLDCDLFDFVSDSSVVEIARDSGVPADRKGIHTHRTFESWSQSLSRHFDRVLTPGATFDALRRFVEETPLIAYGDQRIKIFNELYFRFRTLREAYDYQQDWIRGLSAGGLEVLDLALESPDAEKAELVGRFFDIEGRLPGYPHSNKAR